MKERAADESLSEEVRESAKKALEVLVSSELLDIEQAAAVKKRAAELKDLESEQSSALKKRQVETEFITAKLEADKKSLMASLQASSFEETKQTMQETMQQTAKETAEWLGRHRLSRYAEDILTVAGMCEQLLWLCGDSRRLT